MDTNDFINLLQDKLIAEKVLDALEEIKTAIVMRITTADPSAHDILRLTDFYVNQARRKYKEKTDAYIAAAKQAVYESSIENPCEAKEREQ